MILNPSLIDYYEKEGCCLTCPDAYRGCLCPECRCRKCAHYDVDLRKCSIAVAARDKWAKIAVEIDEVVVETEKGWCVNVDGNEMVWIPKSLGKIKKEVQKEFYCPPGTLSRLENKTREVEMITIPKWLAVEKKLIDLDESDYWNGRD